MKRLFASLMVCALWGAKSAMAETELGTDWGKKVVDTANDLITAKAGVLVHDGLLELGFIGTALILFALIRWARQIIESANSWHTPLHFTDVLVTLGQIWLAAFALNHYMVPVPGTSMSIHQIPMQISEHVVNVLDRSTIDAFHAYIKTSIEKTQVPDAWDLFGIVVYWLVLGVLMLMQLVLFVTTSFGYVGNAIFVLIGPLFIPLALTKHFSSWFWSWVEGMFAFASYRAMATIIGYLCSNVLIQFFVAGVGNDYSIAHWIVMLPVVAMLTALFVLSMFLVPLLCAQLFRGAGAIGQASVVAMGAAVRGIM